MEEPGQRPDLIMRNGSKIWGLVCVALLCLSAVFWGLGSRDRSGIPAGRKGGAPKVQPASKFVFPGSLAASRPPGAPGAPVITNELDRSHPFRLRNTSQSIDALTRNDHAILLANALIDSSLKTGVAIPSGWQSEVDPKAYIVQSTGLLDDAFRAKIAAGGGQVVSYVPNNAYLVRIDAAGASSLAGLDGVQAVLPFEPYYKADERLLQLAPGQPAGPDAMLKVVLFPDAAGQAADQLSQAGAQVLGRDSTPFGPALIINASSADFAALAKMDGVQLVEPYSRRRMMNDLVRVALGVSTNSQIGTTNYLGLTGSNVLVNLNDTGVDNSHPDLAGRIFSTTTNGLQDVDGHGTHVAGIIAGNGVKSSTITSANVPGSSANADFQGKASSAGILIIPTDLQNGPLISDEYLQTTAASTPDAAGTNAFISNNSWGYVDSTAYDSSAASYDAATRDALPATPGMQPLLFVFAAGNSGAGAEDGTGGDADSITSPATAKNVVTVGASLNLRNITNIVITTNLNGAYTTNEVYFGWTDDPTQIAFFSSRGNVGIGQEGEYGRFKPDVVAPGTFVASTRSAQWVLTNEYSPFSPTFALDSALDQPLAPYYRFESGTSMAAPAVSGVLALFQEFFTSRLGINFSPALFKALLINGAQSLGPLYDFQVQNSINLQGWGLVNLPNSIPYTMASNSPSTWPLQFVNQSATNALATGQSRTWIVSLPSVTAQNAGLKFTLVWTDPPGNPAVGVKLVNDLDLIVTNLTTGDVYLGNSFGQGATVTGPIASTNTVNPTNFVADVVNNVENVFLSPVTAPLSASYSVTVNAHRVNVNAVTAQTNNITQDFALVVASENPLSQISLTPAASASNAAPFVTIVTNGVPLLNQIVGANSALAGTTNGQASQWSFYVFTNSVVNGSNVAFATFYPPDLGMPRNQSGDVDLYVSTDSSLTNLNPSAVAGAHTSLNRNGTQSIILTGATNENQVFYIGAKSEDQQGVVFGLFAVASQNPFSLTDPYGNLYINGVVVPQPIPDGSPKNPGRAYVFGFNAIPDIIKRVTVTNTITHQLFGDLVDVLTLNGGNPTYLLNHNQAYLPGTVQFVFDDLQQWDVPGAVPTDGPGRLTQFVGQQAAGLWLLDIEDDVPTHTGTVNNLMIKVEPQVAFPRITLVLAADQFSYDFISVPANATNLTITVVSPQGPVEVFLEPGVPPTLTTYAKMATLPPPGGTLTLGPNDSPPISPGIWFVGFYNPNPFPITIQYSMNLGLSLTNAGPVLYASSSPTPILDDALTTSSISVSNPASIYSLNVGVRIDHPRVSDLVLHLVSPNGSRALLVENRGGTTGTGFGSGGGSGPFLYTAFTEDTNLTSTPIKFGNPNFTSGPVSIGLVPNSTNIVFQNSFQTAKIGLGYKPGAVLDGWTVIKGTVDVFDNGFGIYAPADTPPNALSINGPAGPGVVSNSFTTVVGAPYALSFAYVHDPSAQCVASVTLSGKSFGDITNVVLNSSEANNLLDLNWQHTFVTFVADSTNTSIQLAGINPGPAGMLFDSFVVNGLIPVSGAPYFPEEPMATVFQGEAAVGSWTLEVLDNRVGPPNPSITPQVLSWGIAFSFTPSNSPATQVTPFITMTNTVYGGTPAFFEVNVPATATAATNILVSLTGGNLDVYFNQNALPASSGGVPANGDYTLLSATTNGTSVLLQTNKTGPIQLPFILEPGQAYYLAVMNDDPTQTNTFTLTVDFNGSSSPFSVTPLTNGVPLSTNIAATNLLEYFEYTVTSNAQFVEFTTTNQSGPIVLFANYGLPLPTASSYEYEGVAFTTNSQVITVSPNTGPVALTPGTWFLGVYNPGATPVTYSIEAVESSKPLPASVILLTNGVPYQGTVSGTNTSQFLVYVPPGSLYATNTLISVSGPGVLAYFDQTTTPTGFGTNDILLLATTTNQTVLINPQTGIPLLQPGNLYYLGVQNLPNQTGSEVFTIQVGVDTPVPKAGGWPFLANGVPYNTNMPPSSDLAAFATSPPYNGLDYFAYSTGTNPLSLTFELSPGVNLGLYVLDGELPSPAFFAYASTNSTAGAQSIQITPSSSPVPLGPGQIWYLGVENYGAAVSGFSVEAIEVPVPQTTITNIVISPKVIVGTNGDLTLSWTAPPGQADYIEGKGNLTDPEWLVIPPGTVSNTNGQNSFVLPAGLPFRFFRIISLSSLTASYSATVLSNGIAYSTNIPSATDLQFFEYTVSTNATNVSFTVNNLGGNVQLLLNRSWLPWPGIDGYSITNAAGSSSMDLVVASNSQPVALAPGAWYLRVIDLDATAVPYTIEVAENAGTNGVSPSFIQLTNGVAFTNANLAPPALSNIFEFVVASNATQVIFDLLTNSGKAVLLVNYGSPPNLTNFEYAVTNSGSVTVLPGSKPPLVGGNWFVGVFNLTSTAIEFAVEAQEQVAGFTINPGLVVSTNGIELTWASVPGDVYYVQGKSNLLQSGWTNASPAITATNTVTSYFVSTNLGLHYFRVDQATSGGTPTTFLISPAVSFTTNHFNLSWASAAGATYEVQGKTNLTDSVWYSVSPTLDATNASTGFSIPASSGFRFFRVVQLTSGAGWFRWQNQPLGWPGRRRMIASLQPFGRGANPGSAPFDSRPLPSEFFLHPSGVVTWREYL